MLIPLLRSWKYWLASTCAWVFAKCWEIDDTRCAMVADNMSRNRFQNLLASLHFNDNDQTGKKRWSAGRSVRGLRCFTNNAQRSTTLLRSKWSLSEGLSLIKKYVTGKPHCTSSGILCDFAVYEGGHCGQAVWNSPTQIKIDLIKPKLQSICRQLVFFSTTGAQASSASDLLCRNTPQQLRGWLSAWKWEKSCQKRQRICWCQGWRKKNAWPLSSSMTTDLLPWSHPTVLLNLKTKLNAGANQTKAFVEVNRPYIVKEYNTFMGGVPLPILANHNARPC